MHFESLYTRNSYYHDKTYSYMLINVKNETCKFHMRGFTQNMEITFQGVSHTWRNFLFHFESLCLQSNSGRASTLYKTATVPEKLLVQSPSI